MGSWKNRPVRRGLTWCGDCGKWKAHQAFVRSRVRRCTQKWVNEGFIWKKFNRCNRCTRIYGYKGMSVANFLEQFGAEEHNDSEPDMDEDKSEGYKIEVVKVEGVKIEGVKTEGDKTKQVKFKLVKTKQVKIKLIKIKQVKIDEVETAGDKAEEDKTAECQEETSARATA